MMIHELKMEYLENLVKGISPYIRVPGTDAHDVEVFATKFALLKHPQYALLWDFTDLHTPDFVLYGDVLKSFCDKLFEGTPFQLFII